MRGLAGSSQHPSHALSRSSNPLRARQPSNLMTTACARPARPPRALTCASVAEKSLLGGKPWVKSWSAAPSTRLSLAPVVSTSVFHAWVRSLKYHSMEVASSISCSSMPASLRWVTSWLRRAALAVPVASRHWSSCCYLFNPFSHTPRLRGRRMGARVGRLLLFRRRSQCGTESLWVKCLRVEEGAADEMLPGADTRCATQDTELTFQLHPWAPRVPRPPRAPPPPAAARRRPQHRRRRIGRRQEELRRRRRPHKVQCASGCAGASPPHVAPPGGAHAIQPAMASAAAVASCFSAPRPPVHIRPLPGHRSRQGRVSWGWGPSAMAPGTCPPHCGGR